jgi:hypothetical protein
MTLVRASIATLEIKLNMLIRAWDGFSGYQKTERLQFLNPPRNPFRVL